MKEVLRKNHWLTFGIDFDDVLAPFNDVAVALANRDNGTSLTIADITCWEHTKKTKAVTKYYSEVETYEKQIVPEASVKFINELQKLGDVYIITAVAPDFMPIRMKQIRTAFPNIPDENIIMGYAKNLVHFDITLDDAPHNILKSTADYPVLYRRPWNRSLSGVLAVNTFDEFLTLVRQIKKGASEEDKMVDQPSVIALIGPSGSNKQKLASLLETMSCGERCESCTTNLTASLINYEYVTPEDFYLSKGKDFVAATVYAGNEYGTRKDDIDKILSKGKNVILVLDICGAIGLKNHYPTTIIFCKRSREQMIDHILRYMPSHPTNSEIAENKYRLLSMEQEISNAKLCDYQICTEDVAKAADEIVKLIKND